MNNVFLSGRLVRDPEVRYGASSGMAVARFTLAIDRFTKEGEDKKADYPSCMAFGKTAEFIEKYFSKGLRVIVTGKLQTGSYEKDGVKHYTTDVIADRVEFADGKKEKVEKENLPEGFEQMTDEDLPF